MTRTNRKHAASAGASPNPPIAQAFQDALAHHQAGRLPQAEALYRSILALEPAHADSQHLLGVLAYQVQKYDIAIALIQQAIAANPASAAYHCNLGSALHGAGQLHAAIASLQRAIALSPDYAEAHNNLGNALQAQGDFAAAVSCYRAAIACKPGYFEAYNNLGNALQASGDLAAAVESFRQALAYQPSYATAYNNLGHALKAQGRLDAAIESYRQAVLLNPGFSKCWINLGNALLEHDEADAAVASLEQALALEPDGPEAHNGLGYALQAAGRIDEAIRHFRRAITLKPAYADACVNLGNALPIGGELDAALGCFRTALALEPDFDLAHSNLLFYSNYDERSSPLQYLAEARRFGLRAAGKARPYTAWEVGRGQLSGAPLRVGLVSGDLRGHPVGYFLENVLANLDPQRIELLAYTTRPHEDALTTRIKPRFAQWQSLAGMSDAAAARKIHQDGLHILVDLAGHTAENRLAMFAWKPAPIQVAWLGYFASTGLAEMDYILADAHVLPCAEQGHFVETPWRLPDSYLCFTPPDTPVEVSPLPLLSNPGITFACFNKLAKMNDKVVALWARVLHAVPGSRLLLKARELAQASTQQATWQRFAEHGIAAARVLLEGHTPRAEYLAGYHRVDIALDPFPFPGGTTTVEALWMGVPVLSRRGDRFLSHAGESLLQAAGLGAWVAADDDDYVLKARMWAADVHGLAALRAGLRAQVASSPLCDAPRFARHLEAAFSGMWQTRANSQPSAG